MKLKGSCYEEPDPSELEIRSRRGRGAQMKRDLSSRIQHLAARKSDAAKALGDHNRRKGILERERRTLLRHRHDFELEDAIGAALPGGGGGTATAVATGRLAAIDGEISDLEGTTERLTAELADAERKLSAAVDHT